MKRLVCILLIIAVVFSVVGCEAAPPKKDVATPPQYDENAGVDFESTPTDIISDGKTDYKIVIPANASASETYAASELQNFLRQAFGAELNIVKDSSVQLSTTQKYLSIGKTQILEHVKSIGRFAIDYSSLNFDGFVIKTIDDLVVFDSYNERGILYSVYDFLEKFVGVRFIASDCTYVPNDSDDLSIYDLDIKEVPAFEYRSYLNPMISNDLAFGARMRMVHDYAQNEAKYGYNILQDFYSYNAHNFTDLVSVKEWYEKHPEWFSPQKSHKADCRGSECIDPDYYAEFGKHKQECLDLCTSADCVVADRTEICLTSGINDYAYDDSLQESVARVVIEEIKEQIREKQSARYFFISQEDLGTPCSCVNCAASDEKNGGKSGTLIVFLNVVSDEIDKWLQTYAPEREINIVTFAYEYTLQPPVKYSGTKALPYNEHVVANDNIYIRIAPIQQCYYHPFEDTCIRNTGIVKTFNGWKAVCDNFMIWDYVVNYTEFLWYYPNYSSMIDNLNFYKDMGVIYVMSQGNHKDGETYQEKLKVYLYSKLMWNPNRDVNKLISEFNYCYFGEDIAPYIDEYISIAETHYAILDATEENGFHTHTYTGWGFLESSIYSVYYLEALTNILNQALDKVSTLNLDNLEKDKLEVKILKVLVSVQRMVIRNYSAYYDPSTELAYVKAFVENADRAGVTWVAEGQTLAQFKESYNLI